MSFENVGAVFKQILDIYVHQIPMMIGLALLFTALAALKNHAASPGKVWWRNPGLGTDITYALVHGVVGPYFNRPAVILVYALLASTLMTEAEVVDFFQHGAGPLKVLPFWGQVAVYVVAADFLYYWAHRMFHGRSLWKFHAIHHSATEVDWTTEYRFHPVNIMLQPAPVAVLMLTLGISPAVLAFLIPFDVVTGAWVHSNLNWTLGPLRYVVATPVFHRWHHTSPAEGGEKNFAPTFALWDWLFGTFYMPEGELPQVFGVDDATFPTEGYLAQLIHPFKPKEAAGVVAEQAKPVAR
ncbi:MAG TPA: sterol desaturase family protein [Hyphomicrobium sp.]|nr:sterol desaturase family protein [Hyphomicrobium sp.]